MRPARKEEEKQHQPFYTKPSLYTPGGFFRKQQLSKLTPSSALQQQRAHPCPCLVWGIALLMKLPVSLEPGLCLHACLVWPVLHESQGMDDSQQLLMCPMSLLQSLGCSPLLFFFRRAFISVTTHLSTAL